MGDHHRRRARNRSDQRRENRGQSDLAKIAEEKAGDRDAHLNGRNDLSDISEQQLNNFRARIAGFDELTDARATDSDERKFSRSEESIHSDEKQDGEEMEDNHRERPNCTSSSLVLTCCQTDERTNSTAIECNFSKLCGARGEIRWRSERTKQCLSRAGGCGV